MTDRYTILRPEARGLFVDRLHDLYRQTASLTAAEELEHRRPAYCKVFLSDAKNQMPQLLSSDFYHEFLVNIPNTVIEQPPLSGCKIALLVKTSGVGEPTEEIFHSIRLTDEEVGDADSYEQTRMLFDRYLELAQAAGYDICHNLVRTWIYINNIDATYAGVVEARNDVFDTLGLRADTHYVASTGIGGATEGCKVCVAMDFLTMPTANDGNTRYLKALDHLNPTHEYGVAFERGTRVTLSCGKQMFFISGTASIDKSGQVVHVGDVARQTDRLLENIGALLADGGATMDDIQYFVIYLRDLSDYAVVNANMQQLYPLTPRVIVEAKVCRPGWLIEMECIAEK